MAANISNIGGVYFYMKNYPKALEYYLEAVSIVDELGNKLDMAEFLSSIGNVYIALADYENALKYFYEALTMNTELGNKFGIASNISSLGNLYGEKKYQKYDGAKSEEYLLQSILLHGELGAKKNVLYSHQTLSGLYDQTGEIAKAYKHFKIYHDLEKEVQSEEAKKQAEQLDYERKTVEREKQAAIDRAKHEATEQLLHNVLPPSIATKMLSGTKLIAEKLNDVTVLFADIVNFTKLSQRISPEELVQGLDLIFSEFDLLVEQHGLEKIKTIGDAYMVVAGAPSPRSDHAQIMAVMAIDMQETIKKFSSVTTGAPIEIRIGIHTGEVVAGVIGKKKFQYDLWGDAVNTASRMESHGEAGKIHCTEEFKKKIEAIKSPQFYFLERDEMEIKGKGRMKTYFLE